MAEQDQFGPPGNLSAEKEGNFIDDVSMAVSKFYDNYISNTLTDKEKQEVDLVSKMLNVSRANEDLVRHYVWGQRHKEFPLAGTVGALLGEIHGLAYGPKRGKGGFSPDDLFGTLYGSYGFTPEQVNKVGGFKHTESWQDMVENKSKNQGFFGQNFDKMREISKNQFYSSPSIFGIPINSYIDAMMEDNMNLDFDTNISRGLISQGSQDRSNLSGHSGPL